jgi:hypothetical protein
LVRRGLITKIARTDPKKKKDKIGLQQQQKGINDATLQINALDAIYGTLTD